MRGSVFVLVVLIASLAYGEDDFRPLIWRVSDKDSSIYLLGSVHVLRSQDYPIPRLLNFVYESTEHLVLETTFDHVSADEYWDFMHEGAFYPYGQSLEDIMTPTQQEKLESFLATQDFPYEPRYRPWFYLYHIIGMVAYDESVFNKEGVDDYFKLWAEGGLKPISGLEDWRDPIRIVRAEYQSIPEREAVDFIEFIIDNPEYYHEGAIEIIELWKTGDLNQVEARLIEDDGPKYDEDPLLKDRNLNWMPEIKGYLESNADAFIVVGAAHLPGDWGLLNLLAAEGFELTPLPEEPWVEMEIQNINFRPQLVVNGTFGQIIHVEFCNDPILDSWSMYNVLILDEDPSYVPLSWDSGTVFFRAVTVEE